MNGAIPRLVAAFCIFACACSCATTRGGPATAATATAGAMSAGCANHRLPASFVSDARVVRQRGGSAALYVDGSSEHFGVGAPATAGPAGASTSVTGRTDDGALLRVVRVERPDAGTLLLAIASNEPDREKGLMCVTKMAPRLGMLFVFPHATLQNFWMKDTLIPLDMVFVEGSGRVSSVAASVPSARMDQNESTLARRSGSGRFVIELNAGEAARDHIRPGSYLVMPPLRSED